MKRQTTNATSDSHATDTTRADHATHAERADHPVASSARPGRPDTPQCIGWCEWVALSCATGLLAGVVFGALDALYHGPHLYPRDVLATLVIGAVIGVVLWVPVAIAVRLVLAVVGVAVQRGVGHAVLAGGMVVNLVAAVALVGTRDTPWWQVLLGLVMASGVAACVAVAVYRLSRQSQVGAGVAGALVGIAALMLAACGFAALHVLTGGYILGWVLMVVVAAALAGMSPSINRRPRTATTLAVIAVVVMGTAFSRMAYRFQPAMAAETSVTDKPPDIVLVVLDTTRRDRMGCYGNPDKLTPEFDSLAQSGALYENAFSPSPWTMPSHASMFTGLFPGSHGCSYEHHAWLDDDFDTLAEILARRGYQNLALVSNFYLGRSNVLQGFEKTVFLSDSYEKLALYGVARMIGWPAAWVDKGGAEAAVSLDQWLTGAYDPDKPLFLFVNLFEAHEPYIPPYAPRAAQLPESVGPVAATRFALTFDPFAAHIQRLHNDRARTIVGALYDAEIAYQDAQLETLVNVLSAHVDFDRTLLIVTADHGENLGDAGRWEHLFAINDDLIHVPLLIRYPPRIRPGTRVPGLCQTVDIFGTVLAAAGVTDEPEQPARSLLPDRFEPRDFAYAQVSPFYMVLGAVERHRGFQAGVQGLTAHRRVIHDGRYKLIAFSDGRRHLYDVRDDPLEQVDLATDEPERLDVMSRQLARWRAAEPVYVAPPLPETAQPLDPQWVQRLRDIGYTK